MEHTAINALIKKLSSDAKRYKDTVEVLDSLKEAIAFIGDAQAKKNEAELYESKIRELKQELVLLEADVHAEQAALLDAEKDNLAHVHAEAQAAWQPLMAELEQLKIELAELRLEKEKEVTLLQMEVDQLKADRDAELAKLQAIRETIKRYAGAE